MEPSKTRVKRSPLKPVEYYDMAQEARALGITPTIIYNAIRLSIIKAEYLDKKRIAIHESQLEQLKPYRTIQFFW